MKLFMELLCCRRKIKALKATIRTLERTLEETTPKGPVLFIDEGDGFLGVYQRTDRVLKPHWSDPLTNAIH